MTTQGSSTDQASALGREHGTAAGSWVVDGNSSTETLRAVIRASEAGEFFESIAPELSGPLSGEWAGDPTPATLAEALEVSEESDDFGEICDAYEAGYFEAFEAEAVRSALGMLPEEVQS